MIDNIIHAHLSPSVLLAVGTSSGVTAIVW